MRLSSVLIALGAILLFVSAVLFVNSFFPIILVELDYQLNAAQGGLMVKREIRPVDKDFGIVIPKIGANAKVIPKVDPYNETEYQAALSQGVAHASGTSFPGYTGNVFIFSHSSVNLIEANRYNSIFYLLNKMVVGDEIDLYFNGEKFKYLVTDKKIVDAKDVKYMDSLGPGKTVTLMTSWPAGTTWKRLLVIGELSKDNP